MRRLVCTVLCLGLLAVGLSSSAAGKQEAAGTTGSVTLTEAGTYPIVKDKVTVRFMSVQGVFLQDFATNEFTKFMENKTNVHIEWDTVPEQGAQDKISLILASGDLPDVFFGGDAAGGAITADQEAQYGIEEKSFIPLEGLIDAHMPVLKKVLAASPGSRGFITSTDGHVYSLPVFNDCFHCSCAGKQWVYQPWLDKLGLKMPVTTEDYYRMLKAFKTGDPNGNGKNDELPLAGAVDGWHNGVDEFLINAFVFSDLDSTITANPDSRMGWYLSNGKVDTIFTKADYRDALRYMNKLYREGLIFEGSFTQQYQQLTQLVENPDYPLVGVVTGGWGGMFSSFGGERYRNYRALTPLKGPKGFQAAATFLSTPNPGRMVITKRCTYPEVVARWADYLYSTEGTMRLRRGTPGNGWTWAEKNEVGIDGNPAIWHQLKPWNDKDPQNETWVRVGVWNDSSSLRLGQAAAAKVDLYGTDGLEMLLYQVSKNQYSPSRKTELVVPPLKFTRDEQSELVTTKTEFAKYAKQSMTKFIVGNLDIEKDWDKYLSDLQKLGVSTLLVANQKAYDRQYKK